jgi:hypothetical protein
VCGQCAQAAGGSPQADHTGRPNWKVELAKDEVRHKPRAPHASAASLQTSQQERFKCIWVPCSDGEWSKHGQCKKEVLSHLLMSLISCDKINTT